ncbi:hypothetical protein [Endothiovibrio diazotrophicus]
MENRNPPVSPFAARAAEKERDRARDLQRVQSGEISGRELAAGNALIKPLRARKARIRFA